VVFSLGFGKQAILFGKVRFSGLRSFRSSQVSKISFMVLSQCFGKFGSGFFAKLIFSGKGFGFQNHFFSKRFGKFGSGVLVLPWFWFLQSQHCQKFCNV
jgi:hypothetical protein